MAFVGATSAAHALQPDGADLEFILNQIKKAEAHAGGGQLLGNGPNQIGSPLLPFGLRTVDGKSNNIVPGQEAFGSADRIMPRLLAPIFRPAENFDPDGPGPAPSSPTSYAQTSGIVGDSRPRTISNLVVDQSTSNPAAQAAADATPGSEESDNHFFIPNRAPDTGLSAPFNSWFTLFGQFFDHGLDLTTKGGAGTVMVPLKDDDPLIVGLDGVAGTVDDPASPPPPHLRFMVLTRATNHGTDGVVGGGREAMNTTTPFVDQNQTYTSHPSHQVFLREYELVGGKPVATGRLLDRNPGGGLPRWQDVKAQAQSMLGIALDDQDLLNLPLVQTDPYGRFIPDPTTGFAQIVTAAGPPASVQSGTPGAPVNASLALRTGHAFLDDIAHHAVPFGDHDNNPGTPRQPLAPDATAGTNDDGLAGTYDDELLNAHFITGDGRGNENIGLTAVHHVFHAEHNLRVGEIRNLIEAPGGPDPADWQLPNGDWSGERLFQAARFVTEMEYQHLVFEEFARKVQPQVNVFAGYHADIDPAIVAEFAHTVYRFGHSMLTETVDRKNANGSDNSIGLIDAFLNPEEFHDGGSAGTLTSGQAAGSIVRGMTRQVGSEIDEFVTPALRSNLLGLPLDLATINLARGRDAGVPSLNAARRQFFTETSNSALQPYESWNDFKLEIRHPESLVNFIAAYGTHPSIVSAGTIAAKRAAAQAIINGGPADSADFLNSSGAWASGGGVTTTGLDDVDFWIGGLAEKQLPFGGLLGSTFNFVFETQMEKLQDGDRLYYLARTAGLNFLTQLEENSFTEIVQRTTDTNHLPMDIFSRPDFSFELANIGGSGAVLDDPATDYNESELLTRAADGTVRFAGAEHIVMGGTGAANRMRSSEGDDTMWGDGGNDRLEGGAGNDSVNGGTGNDTLIDLFGDDNIKGGDGDDAINAGGGFDLILGGNGGDVVVGGADPKETFAGAGDDFLIAGDSSDIVFGGEGNDWLEGGAQGDALAAENAAPFEDDPTNSNDILIGDGGDDDLHAEGGDDIMVAGPGIEDAEGMLGFDWFTHASDPQAADADLTRLVGLPPDLDAIRDRYRLTEALSGWDRNDVLRGDTLDPLTLADHDLTDVGLIDGLSGLLDGASSFSGGNIILGGSGSDLIEGRGDNDLIDGDRWLNVRISVRSAADPSVEIQSANSVRDIQAAVFAGTISPSQLRVVREIRPASVPGPGDPPDIDTAVFSDLAANYDITDPDATGDITIVHARGTQADGRDKLKGIERMTFSDGTTEVVDIPTNTPATGTVGISDMTPTEGQALSASRDFADADGINEDSVRFSWQVQMAPNVWSSEGLGESFTPTDRHAGKRVRLVATFQDGDGVTESITSAATEPVENVDNPAPPSPPAVGPAAPQAPLPPPAPAAGQPSTLVGKVLAPLLRVRGLSVSTRRQPITVTVNVPSATKVVRIQVLRKPARRSARRSQRRSRIVGTAFRSPIEGGRHRYRLTERKLRRLKTGRYELHVRLGRSRADLGPTSKRNFTVRKARARR